MSQQRMDHLRTIVNQAVPLDSSSRKAFLKASFAENPELKGVIATMLGRHPQQTALEDNRLLDMLAELMSSSDGLEGIDHSIGPYQVLGLLGEGGMGRVYLAYQKSPIKRKVALKLIKDSMPCKGTLARFKREAQALARLKHPNIASVFDSGLTEDHVPYFTMEYFPGQTIDRFCREQDLGISERIQLMVQICETIQHAHYRGIIHRDLKPSNILVRREADANFIKVIDFGIAKSISGEPLSDELYQTYQGAILGTLGYLSPEQADRHSLEVDTRTDIYGLGAILYELLAGCPPHDEARLKAMPYDQAIASIRLDDPMPPSQRISTNAQKANEMDQTTWSSQLKGELDWLIAKAMDKNKDRRYPTAEAMAEDLRRYLQREPLLAAPVGKLYRLKKFIQRHQLSVLATVMVMLALTLGLGIALISLKETNAAKKASEFSLQEARDQEAKATALFALIKGFIEKPNPYLEKQDPNLKYIDVLVYIEEHIERELKGRADLQIEMYMLLGNTYYTLGDRKKAEHFLLKAEALTNESSAFLRASSLLNVIEFYLLTDELQEAKARITVIETIDHSSMSPSLRLKMARLKATYLHKSKQHKKAKEAYTAILAKAYPNSFQIRREVTKVEVSLAQIYYESNDFDEAIHTYQKIISNIQPIGNDEDHPSLLTLKHHLALTYQKQGQFELAIELFEHIAEARRRFLGEDHIHTLNAKRDAAKAYFEMGSFSIALDKLESLVLQHEATLGVEDFRTLNCKNSLGTMLLSLSRYEEAKTVFQNLYKVQLRKGVPNAHQTLAFQHNLGNALIKLGEYGAADEILKDVLSKQINRLGENSLETLNTRHLLAQSQFLQGHLGNATEAFSTNLDYLKRWFPNESLHRASYQVYLGLALVASGEEHEGLSHFKQGYPRLAQDSGLNLETVHHLMRQYGMTP